MFFVLFLCFFTFVNAHLQQITLPVYVPPTQDVILKKYFQPESKEINATVANDRISGNVSVKIITKPKRDSSDNNGANASVTTSPKAVSDIVWTGLLKNLLRNSYETTTYRYPTATWTAEQHEKLKEYRKNQLRKMPKVFIMKPSVLLKPVTGEEKYIKFSTTVKPKRGRVKWKDSRKKLDTDAGHRETGKDVDKFLEQSLFRYLVSSNLIDNIGNVSVETFSEILRNLTREKADKRQVWPYDENKELRIKFRDEVFMRRKPEVPSRAKFLEKQFQRRLERMKDYLSRKDKLWKSKNGVEVPDKKTTTTETETTFATTAAPITETEPSTVWTQLNMTEPSAQIEESQTESVNITEASTLKPDFEELKLSVAETVYYKKRPFPLKSYSYEEEETGVIPGIPEIDYPMYSSPPSTGFKCPKGIGEQPRMMADTQTRCQVFYVCTGDGPAAAMLCPNGTMFNENVRVCDWWYNVDC